MIRLLIALASAAALLLVSTYDLLASIPFAYQQFIESPPFWWMPVLARLQPVLLVAALGGLRFAIGALGAGGRRAFRLLTIAAVTFAMCMAVPILVPAIASYALSAAMCFAPLIVLAGASAIAVRERATADVPRLANLPSAALGAVAASTAYALNAALGRADIAALQPREVLLGSAATLLAHVALFAGVWLAAATAQAIAMRRSRRAASGAVVAVAVVVLSVLLDRCVLSSLMLEPWRATAVATAFAAAIALFSASVFLAPSPFPAKGAAMQAALCVFVIVACVFALPPVLRFADWAFSVQKLLVMTAWTAAFALAATRARARAPLAVALLIAWSGAVATMTRTASAAGAQPIDASLALERYATVDMSWRALLDVGRPMVSDGAFLSTLRDVGDVTYNRSLPAVPLKLADDVRVGAGAPNIFVVVIDSLRPDYVSAYNPRVTFTPAIAAFARDSVVMRNAYTAYSGTGLSEAALWAGALVQRAMYVKPFAAVDNLERLTVAAGYRRYISIDEVIDRILEDRTRLVPLDADVVHEGRENDAYKLDLCRTVGELTTRLDADRPAEPIFFYTQPKNLHIRVIAGDTPNYASLRGRDEFFRPAAETIGRLDGCFGRFVDYLKMKKLYDDSIIVLTADHGDAYGEEGRWGHAFYVTPETLRIPLIVHVPERMRPSGSADVFDANRVAWLTDVTPTLYALLGITPQAVGELTGRPLFGPGAARPSSDLMLVQSSYSRIFGLMDRDARWLYTADANRLSEELFDLTSTPPRRERLREADRLQYHSWLLDRVRRLNDFFVR